MRTIKFFYLLPLVGLLFFTSCQSDDDEFPLQSNDKVFNIDLFEANIKAAMDGNVTGYQYAINRNGQLYAEGADGWAVAPMDGSSTGGNDGIEQDSRKKMHVASVSKTITAIAAIRCLEENNLSLDDFVYQSLPSSWKPGDCVGNITFRNLLNHTSGFKEDMSSKYPQMKSQFLSGVDCNDIDDDYEYANVNFGMFRVIIPWVVYNDQLEPIKEDDAQMESMTEELFVRWMNENIFQAAGINDGDHYSPEAQNATRYYDFGEDPQNGWELSAYSDMGGFGNFISTYQVNAIMAFLMHSETYFSNAVRTEMLQERLGFETPVNGQYGAYYRKGGDWWDGGGSNGRGLATGIAIFPNGVEASLFINCREGSHAYQTAELVSAYEAAWE